MVRVIRERVEVTKIGACAVLSPKGRCWWARAVKVSKRSRQETVKIELRNRKDVPATVTVIEHFRGDWKFIGTTPKVRKKEARKVEFEVTVPKKSEKAFTYQVLNKW